MKKLLSLTIAALLLCGCAAAEPAPDTSTSLIGATIIEPDTELAIDLDGDGIEETVSCVAQTIPGYDQVSHMTVMVVKDKDSFPATFDVDFIYTNVFCAADLNGDGCKELLLSGDLFSYDYYTYCLSYRDNALTSIDFPCIERGDLEDQPERSESGYGKLISIDEDGILTLCGTQDVLGSWWGSRKLRLTDAGFTTCDDGVWRRILFPDEYEDGDIWDDWRVLDPATDIPCTFIVKDGTETRGTLTIDDKLLITGSDKASIAYFTARDGRNGYLSLEPDTWEGYGHMIEGISESAAFENIPYYD